jgi:hypothetical protein
MPPNRPDWGKDSRHYLAFPLIDRARRLPDQALDATVVRVLQDQAAGHQEARRLNDTNKDKDCRYYVQITRWQGVGN